MKHPSVVANTKKKLKFSPWDEKILPIHCNDPSMYVAVLSVSCGVSGVVAFSATSAESAGGAVDAVGDAFADPPLAFFAFLGFFFEPAAARFFGMF